MSYLCSSVASQVVFLSGTADTPPSWWQPRRPRTGSTPSGGSWRRELERLTGADWEDTQGATLATGLDIVILVGVRMTSIADLKSFQTKSFQSGITQYQARNFFICRNIIKISSQLRTSYKTRILRIGTIYFQGKTYILLSLTMSPGQAVISLYHFCPVECCAL